MVKIIFSLLLLCSTTSHSAQAPSVWVYNQTTKTTSYSTNADTVRGIASITKLMTAIIAIDYDATLNRKLQLDRKLGSRLPPGVYTRKDLFDAMLVRSDNAAAETFANDYPGGRKEFIKAMNNRAKGLGLLNMNFSDPTGLDKRNRATALEVGRLVQEASNYQLIQTISVQRHVLIETKYKQRIRIIKLPNTNQHVLFAFDNIEISKTGFTNAAGWCVAMQAKKNNHNWIIVVLGAQNKAHRIGIVGELMYNHVNDIEELNDTDSVLDPLNLFWKYK